MLRKVKSACVSRTAEMVTISSGVQGTMEVWVQKKQTNFGPPKIESSSLKQYKHMWKSTKCPPFIFHKACTLEFFTLVFYFSLGGRV